MRAALRLWLAALWATVATPEVARPRGVSLARAPLYAPADTFTCLDGSLSIPFTFVNDDYCDCPDGTDEPGTAACPGYFHCSNDGHVPIDLPSSRVNDGICDCCDGADEYSGAACPNVCAELGREARQRAQARAHVLATGARMRAELAKAGARLRNERRQRLAELASNKDDAEQIRQEREKFKLEVEELENAALQAYRAAEEAQRQVQEAAEAETSRQEAEETFKRFDSDADGFVTVQDLQTRIAFDKNRDGTVSDEEASFFLGENQQVNFETFAEVAWPLIKPYLMLEQGLFKPPGSEDDTADIETTSDSPAEHHEDEEEEETDDESEEHTDPEDEASEDGTEAPADIEVRYDEETQRLVDAATEARNSFSGAEKAVREIELEMEKIKTTLDKDYGTEDEFASLLGRCFDFTDREYLYRLCPFDRTTQQPKSGGTETNLGTWGEWNGPSDDRYSSMLYTHGLSCWNGPDRSAKINVRCGLDDVILSVAEPNRCEYVFEFETPAACTFEPDQQSKSSHDEL